MNLWGGTNKAIYNKAEEAKNWQRKVDKNRMKLHRMSQDNKFFLFEDKYS